MDYLVSQSQIPAHGHQYTFSVVSHPIISDVPMLYDAFPSFFAHTSTYLILAHL